MQSPRATESEVVVPVVEEQLHVEKRERERARVSVHKTTSVHDEQVNVTLQEERVEVRRVPVGRVVEAPVAVREEGDVTIIPVLEEVLVIEKRLVLKEEIHIRKVRGAREEQHTVTLRREHVDVRRATNPNPNPGDET